MSAVELLADLCRLGIRLEVSGGRLRYTPRSSVSANLLERLRSNKGELLRLLQPIAEARVIDLTNAGAVWQAALDRLEGDPLFAPDMLEALRAGKARWANDDSLYQEEVEFEPHTEPAPPVALTKGVCSCGSITWRDVPIHGGRSLRRDCNLCGRFIDFPVWHGKDASHPAQ